MHEAEANGTLNPDNLVEMYDAEKKLSRVGCGKAGCNSLPKGKLFAAR
ncbi:hypothetical protein [Paenibacillus sp. GXUN7292]